MSNSVKSKIVNDLQEAKKEGQIRSEKIREIVKTAVAEAVGEIKEGKQEISTLVKEAITAAIEAFKEKGTEIKEEITASIEGAIEGISSSKREAIAKNQEEVKQLQAQIDSSEINLQKEIDDALTDIKETQEEQPTKIKETINSAIDTVKDSEEVALMQKRYAQLKAQLAIVQANLAERYGEKYEDVKKYLDEAQIWYERALTEPEIAAEQIKQKRQEFEDKLGKAGSALAKKERQGKQFLRELWQSITEIFRDK